MATAKEIKEEIISWDFLDCGSIRSFRTAWKSFRAEIQWGLSTIQLPSGPASFVKHFGGEGKGEEYWVLFQVGDELFKVDGHYDSWDGVDWDDAKLYKVAPVEVTVIEYQKID